METWQVGGATAAVTERATVCGAPGALSSIIRVPGIWPANLGAAVTLIVQLAPGSRLATCVCGSTQPVTSKSVEQENPEQVPTRTSLPPSMISSRALPLLDRG